MERATRQKRAILEELRVMHSHPTATELHEALRRRLPTISLGTVYRNLDLLVRQGLIQKLESGRGQARFDARADRHMHVRCVECGRVADIGALAGSRDLDDAPEIGDFEILALRVEYVGVCAACNARLHPEDRRRLYQEWKRATASGCGPRCG